ncbi:hypothetical protein [Calditerricola satsumensis]|uniref:hypothetical protein n=1 Tax=Calditerricola satsumensis TaxID=373054 RepID=UPI00210EADE6|nr:hypothetical protein [Calditerricola satsumensis]
MRDVVDGGMVLFPLWLSLLATVLWVVALINIINFLDGVDGLAAGVTAIAAASLTVIALLKGQTTTPVLTAAWWARAWRFCGSISPRRPSLWATPVRRFWGTFWPWWRWMGR